MRPNSFIMFALAVLFGTVAVFLARSYLEGQASLAGLVPAVALSAAEPMRTIMIATRPLRFGTELAYDHVREIPWPSNAVPSGAFAKASDLFTKEGRRVVLSPIEANEPVLSWKITG